MADRVKKSLIPIHFRERFQEAQIKHNLSHLKGTAFVAIPVCMIYLGRYVLRYFQAPLDSAGFWYILDFSLLLVVSLTFLATRNFYKPAHQTASRVAFLVFSLALLATAGSLSILDSLHEMDLAAYLIAQFFLAMVWSARATSYILVYLANAIALGAVTVVYRNHGLNGSEYLTLGLFTSLTLGAAIFLEGQRRSHILRGLELEDRNRELQENNLRDPLTGLYNRRFLEEILSSHISLAKRKHSALSLAMADIDHFKRINDTWGHGAGDEVLQAIGTLLQQQLRDSDYAVRYGGEEFLLLLPQTLPTQCSPVANRVLNAVRSCRFKSIDGPVTISLGITTLRENEDAASLLQRADRLLYQAKHAGRDQAVIET